MKKLAKFQQAICMFCLLASIRVALTQCLLSDGMQFKKHNAKMLDVKPIEIVEIAYYLECLPKCEARSQCRSVNIKQKENQLICELLASKANEAALIANVNSTHYEDATVSKV